MKTRNPFDWDDVFRPRFGRRIPRKQERVPSRFIGQIQRALQKQGFASGRARSQHPRSGRGVIAVREPQARSRRCVIKARYVKLAGRGLKAAKLHLAYLERDGVERNGSPGKLYGLDDRFDAQTMREPLEGEQRQFRFIVSPEDGDGLDLKEFTREFMKQVERDTGRRLVWAAVNHYNTDNPHAHVVVRGVDRDGDDLRIDGRYIGQEMRWRAQEILTRELGLRSDREMERRRGVDVCREAFTPIDRMLSHYQGEDGALTFKRLAAARPTERAACLARLATLERLGLAQRDSTVGWQLESSWEKELMHLQQRAEVVERVRRAVPASLGRCEVVEPTRDFAKFQGTVRAIGLHDEQGGDMYVVVGTTGGLPRYVAIRPDVAETIRTGDTVAISSGIERWVKPSDQRIARFAQVNGGVYDPVAHQSALEVIRRRDADDAAPKPAEIVRANVRRLERLERYGLSTRFPNGRWEIPNDLLAKLETRERTHPRQSLKIEVLSRGREAPDQVRDPEAMDRAATGARLAKQLGLVYVDSPDRLTGRLVESLRSTAGREYIRVVDTASGRFTLAPKPPSVRELLGRTVTVVKDRERKLSIRIDRDLSR